MANGLRRFNFRHCESFDLTCTEEMKNSKWPEMKRLLGRPSHKWDDNIKMDLK
jgi:hypothetical protein